MLVKASGARSWVLRVQVSGKRRDIGLGAVNLGSGELSIPLTEPLPLIEKRSLTLAEARDLSRELRAIAKAGRDPVVVKAEARKPKAAILTFKQCAERLHEEIKHSWSNRKHRNDWLSSLAAYAFPSLGRLPIDQITAPMVRDTLLPHWLGKPETARRVRQRIRHVIDWSVAHEMRPPLNLSHLQLPKQPRKDKHFAAMPYPDLPAFVASLFAATETIGRLALLFTIATAARSGETRGATWGEIDFTNRLWTIPAERMKTKRPHVVPLNEVALSVLSRLDAGTGNDLIFASRAGKQISDMTLLKLMRDVKLPFTVHGFRSAFKDWAAECTTFPDAVSEAALAHGDPDKTRGAYRRTDFLEKRRQLMAEWASFLNDLRSQDPNCDKSMGTEFALETAN